MGQDTLQSPHAGDNHRTPVGSGSVSLGTLLLWRVKMSIFNAKIRTGKSGEKMGSKECTKQEKGRAHADLFVTKHQPDGETGGDSAPEGSLQREP